jgi:peroxiredoxin
MLAAGSQAPAFRLPCGQYHEATLDDYRGKQLVVVFYVADCHPVCTGQLLRYRELFARIAAIGRGAGSHLSRHSLVARGICQRLSAAVPDRLG